MSGRTGIILRALSGFYTVDCGDGPIVCRARGIFRHKGITPLVGDRAEITLTEPGFGRVDSLLPRRNEFHRPAVANIDALIIIASAVNPVTDPFLIDRLTAMAEYKSVEPIVCINKCDLDPGDALYEIYSKTGLSTLRISAETGEGLAALSALTTDKVICFTGNSGVGKSSILNRLEPTFDLAVGEVSERLGRGRHTTRHIELFSLRNGAVAADTPGFATFDAESENIPKDELADAFREFRPYLEHCRYTGCAHVKERDCAVLEAVAADKIPQSRHASYVRLKSAGTFPV